VNDYELERIWQEAVVAYITVLHGIRLEGPRQTTKTLIRIAGRRAEIRTRDLMNTKQEC
jgi:hypothetical protein